MSTPLIEVYTNPVHGGLAAAAHQIRSQLSSRLPARRRGHSYSRVYKLDHAEFQTAFDAFKRDPSSKRALSKLSYELQIRIPNEVNPTRILERIIKKVPGNQFIGLHSQSAGERRIVARSECIMLNGKLVPIEDTRYCFYKQRRMTKDEWDGYRYRVLVASPLKIELDGMPVCAGVHNRWWEYPLYTNEIGAEGDIVHIHGEEYEVCISGSSNIIYVHKSLTDIGEVRLRYDARHELEAIDSLLSRRSTSLLRGQPGIGPKDAAIGVEIELDDITDEDNYDGDGNTRVYDITTFLRSKLGWRHSVCAVSDGSLGEDGAEFVTGWGEPELVAQAIEDTLTQFGLRGGDHATSRCGVHMHVSRGFFSDFAHIATVQWVMERKAFREAVEYIAHRYNERYCEANRTVSRYYSPQSGKYRGVNCDHGNTIEFRMFAAARTEGDMLHYKDFIFAVIEWTRTEQNAYTTRAFGKWLSDQSQYKRLAKHMEPLFISPEPETAEQTSVSLAEPERVDLQDFLRTLAIDELQLIDPVVVTDNRVLRAPRSLTEGSDLGLITSRDPF